MKKVLLCLLMVICAGSLCAQRYILKDGKVLNQADVAVKDGKLVRTVGGGGAEVTYPFSQVVRLEWPEPAELAAATELLTAGKASEAEEKVTPVYNQFAPFAKLPGSWWSNAAIIRARALLAQKKISEAESAAREINSTSSDREDVSAAQLLLAEGQLRLAKPDIADAMLDEIMRNAVSSEISARAVMLRGDIAYQRKQFEKALGFYLQVPAFYGMCDSVMPAALLGSARAYRGYGDTTRSDRAYLDLIVMYPASAEAEIAKNESHL